MANPLYLSVNWEASGGGAFAVIPLNEKGRLPEQVPLFRGHTAPVLDTDWSPFNDSLVASGSDDGKVFLWTVPRDFTLQTLDGEPRDVAPVSKLAGHSRKVGHVLFNTAAENILATASGDYTVKLWDVESGSARLTLKHGDIVQSLAWSANGSLLVTTSRDKKLRIWDVRQEKPAHEASGHSGAKNSRAVWMGEHDRVATTGFSKMSDRQLGLWDIRAPREPLGGFQILDSISGVCMPFWDDGTQCLYLAGKGDGNIRYFEYENDKFEFLSEYKSADPQRGLAFLPKRGVNTHENEVMRAFKTVNDSYIEPISFIVPRRAEVFQGDIYPPAVGSKPAVSATEWFNGKDGVPPKIDLESIYDGNEPAVVPAEFRPANPAAAPPKSSPPARKEEQPALAAAPISREPAPSVRDQKRSIADMAAKFVDNEEADSDDEDDKDDDFDEPNTTAPKGTDRNLAEPLKATERTEPTSAKGPASAPMSSTKPTAVAEARREESPVEAKTSTPVATGSLWTAREPATRTPSSASGPIDSSLEQIKALLEQQNRTIAAQTNQIGQLTADVNALKTNVGGGEPRPSTKDERIRQLELELEQARS
ncbi:MAG: Coronin-like protein crn1 [Thelocarpon impressellum]|nr:MAG: Coronin-like protein crn1 [Thelocarpon impressellum]